ncbi:MAG TPA: sulfite oxidase [Candidatus Dormibacteraeota bacterium]|nr:sulfite oxidase [Candidatus Dormibacteraeota bacterium]
MKGRLTDTKPAGTLIPEPGITPDELQLAVRNHSMPLEALRYDLTPVGLHYLLIHFDIPVVDPDSWVLNIGGYVRKPLRLDLQQIRNRPAKTIAVTLECAGNGRARLSPRPLSQPWLVEAVGTAEWTGTPLGALLEEAGVGERAGDVVFTGLDRGIQGDVEQHYERSLPLGECWREEVLLAYAINGSPLPPQHGFPLRLIVPGWYGMAHVKWLRGITVLESGFEGYQQATAYHYRLAEDDRGVPVTRMLPRALMVPPGIPDFMSRVRFVSPSHQVLTGRAWSGGAPVTKVEVSVDGGKSWAAAELGAAISAFAWRPWSYAWDATRPGDYELSARATDAEGNVQPTEQNWNREGVQNNSVQRIRVVVADSGAGAQVPADRVS